MSRPELQRSVTTGLRPNGHHPPPLRVDKTQRSFSSSSVDAKGPRTPGNKITNFFGWKNSSPGSESASTEVSEPGQSSLPSPAVTSPQTSSYSMRSNALNIDVTKANNAAFRDGQYGAILPPPTAEGDLFRRVAQLETELREISAELAGSIRREMDLEDAVERLQSEGPQMLDYNQRTSDYFSDSGTSSVRANPEPIVKTAEEIERIKRRSEQERAQLKVTLSQKWQEERSKRKALEAHVQILEDRVAQSRRDKLDNSDLTAKAKEMEIALDDARRRLAEERQTKENFEDLLTALRVDLEQHRNERDNLRDEIVPQLKTQLQGLEYSAAEATQISYDYARLQQEVEKLRTENNVLVNARKMQQEMQQTQARFGTINEEEETRAQSPVGLSRPNSLARAPSRAGLARSGSLSRSNSISGKGRELPESLVERIKDVEMQRDALHSAVKSLLDRNNAQTRDYEKRIKYLEIERDRAVHSSSPRRQGYEKEVKNLREEINTLRKRSDEAVEQKYQCEKGLGGLKMDLDRAEQETSTLRKLLQEHDIALPEHINSSLEASYNQLQRERQQIQSQSQFRSLEEEQILADQLSASAARSEALAAQVRQQLLTNNTLRTRLAEAVSKGEMSQRTSTNRINELQSRLKKLEDTVTIAQQQSETGVMKHEEEIRILKDSHSAQLQRVRSGLRTPTNFSPKSPLSPLFAARSPRLDKTTSGPGMPLNQVLKTEWLEKKVKELETALGDADKEMEEVVGRMNMAQIEVAELQSERYV